MWDIPTFLYALPRSRCNFWCAQEIDLNGDGEITQIEFIKVLPIYTNGVSNTGSVRACMSARAGLFCALGKADSNLPCAVPQEKRRHCGTADSVECCLLFAKDFYDYLGACYLPNVMHPCPGADTFVFANRNVWAFPIRSNKKQSPASCEHHAPCIARCSSLVLEICVPAYRSNNLLPSPCKCVDMLIVELMRRFQLSASVPRHGHR